MKTLFDETQLNNMNLKNRLIRSATWEGMADADGRPTARLSNVYRSLANGGTGLIITGTAFITSAGLGSGNMGIYDDTFIRNYHSLTQITHQADCPVVLQIALAPQGAKTAPAALSVRELQQIIHEYGKSALRAKQAGFDGVQIHVAHGFFLSQFIHPEKNTRQDEYGGSLPKRTRFLLEIYDEIRTLTGEDFSVLLKIDGTDVSGSTKLVDACQYACVQLVQRGLDAIEISGEAGAVIPGRKQPYPEAVFRDYAANIAELVQIPVILVGLNRTPAVLETLLNTTNIAYFSLSRPLIREPDLVNLWRLNPNKQADCISCNRCFRSDGNTCVFR